MDRRGFLASATATTALALLARGVPAAAQTLIGPRPRRNDASLWLDAQGVVDGFDWKEDGSFTMTDRMAAAIRDGRMDAISVTLGQVGNGPDRFRSAAEAIARWDGVIAAYPQHFVKITNSAELRGARMSRRMGIIYNFQDTVALEGDTDNVRLFRDLGVRVMQLTYNKRNLAGDGCLERSNAGLSDFGRAAIAAINDARVVLDLSHSGQRTIAEGIAETRRPCVISHSGCRALVDLPRNVADAEMRALADKGGVFGVYLMPFLRLGQQAGREDLLRHLDHAVRVCGEDHVGIGTDNLLFGIVVDDAARKAQRESYAERSRNGVAAPGEGPELFTLVEGYNDIARFDRIAADLSARGWTGARIDKVLGGNFARVFAEVWSV